MALTQGVIEGGRHGVASMQREAQDFYNAILNYRVSLNSSSDYTKFVNGTAVGASLRDRLTKLEEYARNTAGVVNSLCEKTTAFLDKQESINSSK